jgi:hypothetical protein
MAAEGNVLIGFTKWVLKWIGIVAGSLIALALVAAGVAYSYHWWTVLRHEAAIKLVVSNHKHCTDKFFPTFVGFVNDSSKTVEYLSIRVRAYLPTRSPEILNYSEVKFDRLVKPTEGFGNCFSFVPRDEFKEAKDLEKAIYTAEIDELRFWDGFRGTTDQNPLPVDSP